MLPDTALPTFKNNIKSAEIKMSLFLAKHNLPFSLATDLQDLIQSIDKDSKIAAKLQFGRGKAHDIITHVTGQVAEDHIINRLKNNKFSLIVDESTDRSTTKHLALIARTAINFKVKDNFLGLLKVSSSTASDLHNDLVSFFEEKNIPFKENMIGFAADGTNSMFGQHHSLSKLLSDDIPDLFLMKCICHSFHLCASYACKELPRNIEDFAREVYTFIQNSPKRIAAFQEFQAFVNVKPHKLLKPCQTRWLSLMQVVKRLLEQLPALKLYFQEAVLNDRLRSAEPILKMCIEPTTEFYLEFLNFVLPIFNELNLEMQSESPKLYLLYEKVFRAYKTIMECFIKPEHIELSEEEPEQNSNEKAALESKILNCEFENSDLHLDFNYIYLGGNVAALTLQKSGTIDCANLLLFRQNCLKFFIESLRQIKKRFPFNNEHMQKMKQLQFLNPAVFLNKKLIRNIPSITQAALSFSGNYFKIYCFI